MDGHGVESLEDDILFAVDTVVVERESLYRALVVIVVGPHKEWCLVQVLLDFILFFLVDFNSLELLFLINDVELAHFYFRLLLRVVVLGESRHGQCQKSNSQNNTFNILHQRCVVVWFV